LQRARRRGHVGKAKEAHMGSEKGTCVGAGACEGRDVNGFGQIACGEEGNAAALKPGEDPKRV